MNLIEIPQLDELKDGIPIGTKQPYSLQRETDAGTVSIERCREELKHLSELYQAGHPDRKGLETAMGDWVLEEVALLSCCPACAHTPQYLAKNRK